MTLRRTIHPHGDTNGEVDELKIACDDYAACTKQLAEQVPQV